MTSLHFFFDQTSLHEAQEDEHLRLLNEEKELGYGPTLKLLYFTPFERKFGDTSHSCSEVQAFRNNRKILSHWFIPPRAQLLFKFWPNTR